MALLGRKRGGRQWRLMSAKGFKLLYHDMMFKETFVIFTFFYHFHHPRIDKMTKVGNNFFFFFFFLIPGYADPDL